MAILPLSDDAPVKHIRYPYVTTGLITFCILLFVYQLTLTHRAEQILIFTFGAIPSALFGLVELHPEIVKLPAYGTLISSMFLHSSLMHIIGNLLFLWVLGDNVEDDMGHGRYLIFYLICGILAGLAHAISDPRSTVPMIGASGAISGIIGAYLMLHPRAPIKVLVWFIIVWLPAWLVLGFWIGYQFLSIAMTSGGSIAWWAHIGGFLAGAGLIIFMRRKGVPLLDKNYVKVNHRLLSTQPRKRRHG